MTSALEKLKGEQTAVYDQYEQAVREYFELPSGPNGQRDESARSAITAFAASSFGWSEPKIRDDMWRIGEVIGNELVAGTIADREKLSEEAQAATDDLKKQRPGIEKQIRKLQDTLSSLDSKSQSLTGRLKVATAAAAKLQKLEMMPFMIRQQMAEIRSESAESAEGTKATVQDIEADIFHAEKISEGPIADPDILHDKETYVQRFAAWLESIGLNEFVADIEHETYDGKIRIEKRLRPEFAELQAEMRKRLPQLSANLEEAQANQQTTEEKIANLRKHYLK